MAESAIVSSNALQRLGQQTELELKQVAREAMAKKLLDKYVFSQPGHKWLQEGMTKEQLQKIQELYRQRYGEPNQISPSNEQTCWTGHGRRSTSFRSPRFGASGHSGSGDGETDWARSFPVRSTFGSSHNRTKIDPSQMSVADSDYLFSL